MPPLLTGRVPVTFAAKLTKVVAVVPVPPFAIASVPATVTAPEVAVAGVRPVVPKEIVVTGVVAEEDANSVTAPALFKAYSFMSALLSANSPATMLPDVGTAEAVVL